MCTFQPMLRATPSVPPSMRTNMERSPGTVKALARNLGVEQPYRHPVTAKCGSHGANDVASPNSRALNQEELTCLAEIEQPEMQETTLEYELKQDIDESRRIIAMQTLRVLYKALLLAGFVGLGFLGYRKACKGSLGA